MKNPVAPRLYKETADILNIPLGTVLSRLSRAQRKLKELLSPYSFSMQTRMQTHNRTRT